MTQNILKMPATVKLTSERFYDLCRENPESKLERTAEGNLVIMAPTGGETGARNAHLLIRLGIWNERSQLGVVFDSSTGFHLPNGADRSPDVSWTSKERWNALSQTQRETFPPLAPDFVIELMSPSDNLGEVRAKMQEYLDNGVRLGWLFNRKTRQVEIYQLGREQEILLQPARLCGDPVLPGFTLDLDGFW